MTNLFYADNERAALNYICHKIAKPCALLCVSDGVFDPFDPFENLGVEHTLLSSIEKCESKEQLCETLKKVYDGVHNDDATMTFQSFGFCFYENMREKLAARTKGIMDTMQKLSLMRDSLEAMNRTEEEAADYVMTRTRDRYESNIVPVIVDLADGGNQSMIITPEVEKIVKRVRGDCVKAVGKIKRERQEQALRELYDYVREYPERVASDILTRENIDFYSDGKLVSAFSDVKKYSREYAEIARKKAVLRAELEKNAQREELHDRVMERIYHYRVLFDRLWHDPSDISLQNIPRILNIWNDIYVNLQINWKLSRIGSLPEADRPLAREVNSRIDEYIDIRGRINSLNRDADPIRGKFNKAWAVVYSHLQRFFADARELLTPEAVQTFGFDFSEKSLAAELNKGVREKISSELKENREIIIAEIVEALAANWDKQSVIDKIYNATKLEQFRTYYRLKTTDNSDLKEFEEMLAWLQREYTSLVTK